MESEIDKIFNSIEYWQDKNLLLRAIRPEHYANKNILLKLLGVTSGSILPENEAKKDMWNYQIVQHNMGDDILNNVIYEILDDFSFAKTAIGKYNRTYLFLNRSLRASEELAMAAVIKEQQSTEEKYHHPILQYMPPAFQTHHEISLMATTRNIENLQYAPNLRTNKYFIIDMMNLIDDHKIKQKILKYIDKDLLSDKIFVAKLGCFDNLCENFHGDIQYVANAVRYDLSILKKTDIFDESILKAALKNKSFHEDRDSTLALIFRYIENFNEDFDELNLKIKDKKILNQLFWYFGESISDEFI